MMKKILFEDALIYHAIRLLEAAVNALPEGTALGLARAGGSLYARLAKRRQVASRNLRAAFAAEKTRAELREILRKNFEHFAMNIVELLRAPGLKEDFLTHRVRIEGNEVIERYLAQKRGAILLTAHFGNWELLNIVGGLKKYPMTVFAKTQKHPRADGRLNAIRASQGAEVVFRGMQARQLVARLEAGRVVGFLADQDAGANGVFVPFLGRRAAFPRGVVHFARRAGAPIIPVFHIRGNGGRHRIVCEEEIHVDPALPGPEAERAVIGVFARLLERRIREHPEQWLWPHRRWKSTPDRACVILSDGKQGHLSQSTAFYAKLAERRRKAGFEPDALTLKVVVLRFRSPFRKKVLGLVGILGRGHFPFSWRLLGWALEKETFAELQKTYADHVISCGSSTEAVNLIFSRENGARSCFIHKPQFGAGPHAVVLVPRHDGFAAGANVFGISGALTFREPDAIKEIRGRFLAAAGLDPAASRLRVALIVGGPTRRAPWDETTLSRAIGQIKTAYVRRPFDLFVTSSRRTGASAEALLKRGFADFPPCRTLVIAGEKNPDGVYAGMLAAGDLFIVTADSVSMVSEAYGTGRPVLALLPNERGVLDRKLRLFLSHLEEGGRLRVSRSGDLSRAILASPALSREALPVSPDEGVLEKAASRLLEIG